MRRGDINVDEIIWIDVGEVRWDNITYITITITITSHQIQSNKMLYRVVLQKIINGKLDNYHLARHGDAWQINSLHNAVTNKSKYYYSIYTDSISLT